MKSIFTSVMHLDSSHLYEFALAALSPPTASRMKLWQVSWIQSFMDETLARFVTDSSNTVSRKKPLAPNTKFEYLRKNRRHTRTEHQIQSSKCFFFFVVHNVPWMSFYVLFAKSWALQKFGQLLPCSCVLYSPILTQTCPRVAPHSRVKGEGILQYDLKSILGYWVKCSQAKFMDLKPKGSLQINHLN